MNIFIPVPLPSIATLSEGIYFIKNISFTWRSCQLTNTMKREEAESVLCAQK